MLCYKDRAWCSWICANEECPRNYTDEEREHNRNSVDLPVSFANFRTDECGFRRKVELSGVTVDDDPETIARTNDDFDVS